MKHINVDISRRGFLAGATAAVAAAASHAAVAKDVTRDNRPSPYTLHFAQPASKWPNALPVCNGRLGAMVFGVPAVDRVQLNEESIWDGEPNRDRNNPKAAETVKRMRELLFAGKVAEAEASVLTDFHSLPRRMPCYQTLGDLHLDFSGMGLSDAAKVEDYRLQLDLDTAVVTTTFAHDGVSYRREVFSSAPDQAIVVRLTASKPGALSVKLTLDRPGSFNTESAGEDRLAMTGQALPVNDNPGLPVKEHQTGVRFYAELQAIAKGGRTHAGGTGEAPALIVEKADAITLLIDCATSYRYPAHAGKISGVDADVLVGDAAAMKAAVRRNLSAAAARSYDDLLSRHTSDHQRYFRRVGFDLGADAHVDTPTDVRVKAIKDGGDDPQLLPIYFQFGRYMLISSSRPGTLASNLQGIWNESVDPPWGSKYTININTEMNYWFAEAANLSECHLPMFDLLAATQRQGAITAREIYGAKGVVVHHNTDIWGDSGPIDAMGGGVWPMGACWLSLHLWTHYMYTGDRRFLGERAYPLLRANIEFLRDYMVRDPKSGHLITGPSCSPENAYIGHDGKPHNVCMAPTMDTEIVRAVFARFLEAAAVLGKDVSSDAALFDWVRNAWSQLPPFQIARDGRLQEWPEDYREREPGHRHISHLLALFPEDQITVDGTPELARAARLVLDKRLAAGGGSTGWSRSWIINCMARLRDGEACHENILELFRQSTRANLFDVCGLKENSPFQIDGNLGAPNGLIEMLLQSQGETPLTPPEHLAVDEPITLRLLPALPKTWATGSFRGLRARGGAELAAEWRDGKLVSATLATARAQAYRVVSPQGQQLASVRAKGRDVRFDASKPLLELKGGTTYELTFA